MSDVVGLERLAYWLRPVQLEASGIRQKAIEQAATELDRELSGRDVLDIVLLAHGRPIGAAYQRLAAAIAQEDETFGSEADDLESHIAAGAVVAVMLAGSDNAGLAAHSVLSAGWAGLNPAIAELPQLAGTALLVESERVRSRDETQVQEQDVEIEVENDPFGAIPAYEAEGQAIYSEDLRLIVEVARETTRRTAKAMDSLSIAVLRRIDAADEELNLLWWAFSDYSESAGLPWSEISSSSTAAIAAGVEMSTRLRFPVELPSTEALLSRLLGARAGEPTTVADAVEAAADLLTLGEAPGHQLLPLASSFAEYKALEGKQAWRESVTRWNIDVTNSQRAVAFGQQMLRELLLVRNL